ncbi:Aldolase-type TIM barrel [Pleurostoma richardsiae]|uniref:Aldolase-type TIM barrel n=1 Tax=Pleurostoma richardsiae TaxID=41990 RepID=A0AA38RJ29_9PEZI|nr:Aldolase-type TIM barrel [Pleurostoma richardsiae]
MFVKLIFLVAAFSAKFCTAALDCQRHFRVFDNTAYLNTSIGYGTTNINWIPNYVCKPLVEAGALPSANEWRSTVLQWNIYPGYPLVLDCEDLYFTSESTADRHLEILSALQTWAADVLPEGQIIGWYGLSGNTIPELYDHYRSLIANHSHHAFFPSAYTFTSSISDWNASLDSVVQKIKTIDSTLPIIPYTWPQYHNNYSFFPADLWKSELAILSQKKDINGFVIWGGKNHQVCDETCQATAGQQPWLDATRGFLKNLYGIYNGRPQVSGAQLFTGL